jgi:hypothetical protein
MKNSYGSRVSQCTACGNPQIAPAGLPRAYSFVLLRPPAILVGAEQRCLVVVQGPPPAKTVGQQQRVGLVGRVDSTSLRTAGKSGSLGVQQNPLRAAGKS